MSRQIGWNTGGGGGAVDSVFGRTGPVIAAANDYAAEQISSTSTLGGATVLESLDAAKTLGDGAQADATQALADAGAAQSTANAKLASFNGRTATAAVPTSGDYSVGMVTGAAPLASPPLTGTPTAPTAAPGTNTTQLATTAFVGTAAATAILPAYFTTAGIGPTISGTGLQTYITVTTPSLAAGTYSIAWSVVSTHTATGSSQGVQMTAGATVVPTATIDGGAATANGSRTIVQARGFYVHAGGTLALLVQVRRSSGTGNVIPQSGSIELRRVA